MKQTPLIVVGAGMVAQRFCERLRELDQRRRFAVLVLGEENLAPYDRVNLSSYYEQRDPARLRLGNPSLFGASGYALQLGDPVTRIDLRGRSVTTRAGHSHVFEHLVLATGAAPDVPTISGIDKPGVFVYRSLSDLKAIEAYARGRRNSVVLGGGLLGLEAARALIGLGLRVQVVEQAPHLLPRQLDLRGAALVQERLEVLGIKAVVGSRVEACLGAGAIAELALQDGRRLAAELLVVATGVRPRVELARAAGLRIGEAGVIVDDELTTSTEGVYAIGDVAEHRGVSYGLFAPAQEMAEVLVQRLLGHEATFQGSDLSTQLKLPGLEVAFVGGPALRRRRSPVEPTREVVNYDALDRVYQKLVLGAESRRLISATLVGDSADYTRLLAQYRAQRPLASHAERKRESAGSAALELDPETRICNCNRVTRKNVCEAVAAGARSIAALKARTRAATGCGGCEPLLRQVLRDELCAAGQAPDRRICEHFDLTRQALFEIVAVRGYRRFDQIIEKLGRGHGCETCKPLVASVLASVHNEPILDHETLQDSNDRYLANVQRGGLYSVVPRIPAGEITPDKLIALGEVAKRYNLYTKITGGQRIDMFGARLDQLPEIWEALIKVGFESGHSYGKAMRTVKSCVGSSWCRYGVQDAVAFAIRLEERYKGIRAPQKLKSAVSGCTRECAEVRSKDFGVIATERGWDLYVAGNGGATPRHADLLASDLEADECVRVIDRFLMFYIRTADKLTRTSVWLDQLDGGIEHLRAVVLNDSLGLCAELEREMRKLIASYRCEWSEVVNNPERRSRFQHFANTSEPDTSVRIVDERAQPRPAAWPAPLFTTQRARAKVSLPTLQKRWVPLLDADAVPRDGGVSVRYGRTQLAVYNFASRGQWYATQNMCPHRQDMVLARGILGDEAGQPKISCPLHHKRFALDSGACLDDERLAIATFPVQVQRGIVYVELPAAETLEPRLCKAHDDAADRPEA
jgi:nitrite reductase (NADH) large subunit